MVFIENNKNIALKFHFSFFYIKYEIGASVTDVSLKSIKIVTTKI
jgi:hypothetical protein